MFNMLPAGFPLAILETVASVTRSNPAGNAFQHSDVISQLLPD